MEDHMTRCKRSLVAMAAGALLMAGIAGAASTRTDLQDHAVATATGNGPADGYQNGGVDPRP
jgi:hypothetical protein